MLANHTRTVILGLAAIVFTSACTHVSVPVQVTRPAEINLANYKKIAVGPFQGKQDVPSNAFDLLVVAVQALADAAHNSNGAFQTNWQGQRDDGSDVALHVFNSLTKTGRFSMIDFSFIPSARSSGDAVLMVSGTVARKEVHSGINTSKHEDKNGKIYYSYTRTTQANYNVNLNLVDVSSGAIYMTRQYPCSRSDTRSQTNKAPKKLSMHEVHGLYDQCKLQIAKSFAKAVAPYTETVTAWFAKIDNSPDTEIGINHARAGNWTAAIASFKAVPPTQTMAEPKVQAKTWWNLGLAYEYNYQFSKASEMVQKAMGLYPDSRYSQELTNISLLQQSQERLKQQEYKGDKPAVPPGS